jgi:hypothetical protein
MVFGGTLDVGKERGEDGKGEGYSVLRTVEEDKERAYEQ